MARPDNRDLSSNRRFLATKSGGFVQFFFAFAMLLSMPVHAETVKYLDNAQLSLSALYDAIRNASESIEMTYYEAHQCDTVFKVIVQAIKTRSQELKRAGKRPLRVRFVVDYHPFLNMQEAQQFRAYLRVNGIESRVFNSTGLQNRNHSKYTVVDGRVLITGGRNLGDAYYAMKAKSVNYIDRDVLVEGQAARDAVSSFNRIWRGNYAHGLDREDPEEFRQKRAGCFVFGDRERRLTAYLEGSASATVEAAPTYQCNEAQFVTDTRVRFTPKATAVKIVNLLKKAESTIHLENYSYLPFDNLDKVLKQKRQRVQIQLFTNHFAQGQQESQHDHLHRYYLARDNSQKQANFPISLSSRLEQDWYFSPRNVRYQIHSKVYVVDTKHVAITSSNIDPRSLSSKLNLESGITFMNCPELAYAAEMKSHELFRGLETNERMSMRSRLGQYERDQRSSFSLRYLLQSAFEDLL